MGGDFFSSQFHGDNMFIVYKSSETFFAVNLNTVPKFAVNGKVIQDYQMSIPFVTEDSVEEALNRFDDIIEAAATDLKVYDTRKEVGYWKAPKTAAKKPGPKPKAKEPASREHHEPAPKK